MRTLRLAVAAVLWAAVIGSGTFTTVAAAQGEARGGRRPMRDEAFKIVDAYLLSNMQEAVGLTDDQFVKAMPLAKKLQEHRRGFAERRFRLHRKLRDLLASGSATEATITEEMKELRALEIEEPQVLRKDREALDEILSPVQQAKYRILEAEVERKIRELLRPLRNALDGRPVPRNRDDRGDRPDTAPNPKK